jgi:hypothetical protein
VKENQRKINDLKAQNKVKQQTLKTYEHLLMQPKGAPVEVFKCAVCLKFYATDEYLKNHYRREHPDYYRDEINKENQDMINILSEQAKEAQMTEDALVEKLRTDVMENFGPNFYKLQKDLETLQDQNHADQVEELLEKERNV